MRSSRFEGNRWNGQRAYDGRWNRYSQNGYWRRGAGYGAGVAVGVGVGLGYPYVAGGGPYADDYYEGYAATDDYGYAAAPEYDGQEVDAQYCAQRFRSYDPASGTYLGYDGLRHPCP